MVIVVFRIEWERDDCCCVVLDLEVHLSLQGILENSTAASCASEPLLNDDVVVEEE